MREIQKERKTREDSSENETESLRERGNERQRFNLGLITRLAGLIKITRRTHRKQEKGPDKQLTGASIDVERICSTHEHSLPSTQRVLVRRPTYVRSWVLGRVLGGKNKQEKSRKRH